MDPNQLSGLEKVQSIIDGVYPITNMARTVPMAFSYAEDGLVQGNAVAKTEHQNYSGRIHGGFAATVIDTFAAVAILTKLQPGEWHTTIDLNVKMLKPVPLGETVYCEGKVINMTKSLGVADATIKDANGRILAYGNTSCMVFRNNNSNERNPNDR